MKKRNKSLHGSAPDKTSAALLLIDLISDYSFPDGKQLLRKTLPVAKKIRSLKQRAKAAGLATIYVNDNFGRWQSDFRNLIDHCGQESCAGKAVVSLLRPEEDDYFVLKPKHSGFFATTLNTLLEYLGVRRLILTGVTSHQCILFTANDAYLRDFELFIPRDCIASPSSTQTSYALRHFKETLKADLTPASRLDLAKLRGRK